MLKFRRVFQFCSHSDFQPKFKEFTEEQLKQKQEEIDKIVKGNNVVLFMKGTPAAPMCGYSNYAVQVLQFYKVQGYHSVDVLADNLMREEVKKYSNWPTFPQLVIIITKLVCQRRTHWRLRYYDGITQRRKTQRVVLIYYIQMLEIEKQNYSRQIVKQDKELSQFIKYLELQNSAAEKNKQTQLKMKQREAQLEGLREQQKETRDLQSKLKSLEISTIREQYDEKLKLENQRIKQKLIDNQIRHDQILSEATQLRNEKSMLRNLLLNDSVDKAIEKSLIIEQQRVSQFKEKAERKEDYLRQQKSLSNMRLEEKSALFAIKQDQNNLNYRRANDILNQQVQRIQSKIDQKDSLSQQILFENERKLQSKIFQQQASLNHGLTNANYAQQRFLENLDLKQSMTEYKMKKLDQLMYYTQQVDPKNK